MTMNFDEGLRLLARVTQDSPEANKRDCIATKELYFNIREAM